MKHTKPYYYKPKTVNSIAFINYTKLYCRKTSFFTKTIMLILTTCILTGLKLKVACLKSDNLKKKDRMIIWEKENERSYDFDKSKVHIKKKKKESTHIKRLIDSTSGSQATNHNRCVTLLLFSELLPPFSRAANIEKSTKTAC